ncbi:MAG TPA: RecX family transcriptional regulator [Clostridia bacterium]|nr:RecX family transcriptional regulator [Clostridia bacterium]
MRITKIEEQKKNKKKYSIYIDGEYHSSIDKEVLEELDFREGMELNKDEFNKKMEIIQYKSALRASLFILAHSSKTEKEIIKKLKEKQHSDSAIKKVLEYLRELGYINDENYADSFIRTVKDNTGTSRRSLYNKLASKGVDSEVIRQKLEESDIDDYASALKAAQKKLPGLKGNKSEKAAKLMGFLYRKGYGMDVCRRIIEELELDEG